ncbi:MAG TPA: hypothetical protein VFP56_09390 [Candidatus Limnocylindrales bacterium]|nr:hypothetical protein [Candidatus Limnocylindrales bacterium]
MSRRRWVLWLGPPIARAASLTVVLAAVVVGCAGAYPAGSLGAATTAPDGVTVGTSTQESGPARGLVGKTWLAEGATGWEAGRIAGTRSALGASEIGVATGNGWIVSAELGRVRSIKLLIRDQPGAAPKTVALGSLAPTATAVVGSRAFVSGFLFGRPDDPGILDVDLLTATSRALLEPTDAEGTRYLAASPDGSTVVSSLCELAADPEPATCTLTVLSLVAGTATTLGDVPGGLLRGTSSDVAVIGPQGAEPPGWLAGIDLATGKELWRVAGGEFGPSVVSQQHGLIQQRIRIDGPKPRLVIEAFDLRSGAPRILYEETGNELAELWPALCTDTHIAIGEDATGSRAIGPGAPARTRVRLVPIDGGETVDLDVSMGSLQ